MQTRINISKIRPTLMFILLFHWAGEIIAQTQDFIWAEGVSGTANVAGYGVATDGQGNAIVVGGFEGTATFGTTQIQSPGIRGIFVAKYSTLGNLIWIKGVENTILSEALGVATDDEDNILVTGYFQGNATFETIQLATAGAEDIFIVKYDSAGNVLWAKQAGGSGDDRGQSVAVDGRGNSYVTGTFVDLAGFDAVNLTSRGGTDIFIVKYDQSGEVLWAKQAGGFGNADEGRAIAVDEAGNSAVTGRFESKVYFDTDSLTSSGGTDIFIARYDASGFLQWVRQAGGIDEDTGLGIAVNGSGHTWVTGQYRGFTNFGQYFVSSLGLEDVFIVKYDGTGNVLWADAFGDSLQDGGSSVIIDEADYCTVTGRFRAAPVLEDTTLVSHGGEDVFVVQYDGDGSIQWIKQAGGTANDAGFGVTLYDPCRYFITGYFHDAAAFGTTTLNVQQNPYEGMFLSRLDIFDLHTDSLSLITLYNSTEGPNWTTHTNWLTGPVTSWHGVSTFNNRVTQLNISFNNVSGSIPLALTNLTELFYLKLGYNQLSGPLLPEMGNLTRLTDLHLSYNRLTGTIPITLSNLPNLTRLDLSGNQLSGTIPTQLGNLINLTELYLTDNLFSGPIPARMGNLTNLTRLDLTGNLLDGTIPGELGNLINLTDLYLADNQLSGTIPGVLGNLTRLQAMYLNNNRLTGGIPQEFLSLTNLGYLVLSSNQLSDLPDLSSLTNLNTLSIQNNRLTFEDIEPNVSMTNFTYSPQDSVGTQQDTTIGIGESITLSTTVGGTANQYQWFRGFTPITGATSSDYVIASAAEADSGTYKCRITNTIAPNLVLYNRPTRLKVQGIGTVAFSSSQISFGRVLSGLNATQSVWVKNAGDNTLFIRQIRLTGPDAEAYIMTAGSGVRSVAVADSFRIAFQFTPTSTGTKTAYLIMETNAQSSPDTVSLTGVGSLLDVTQDQSLATPGDDFTLTVSFPQSFAANRFTLFYRMAGQVDYQEAPLTATASDTVYSGTIPQNVITIRGVEYYVQLEDGQITATLPVEDAAARPIQLSVQIPRYSHALSLGKNTYRMVSVPANLQDPSIEGVFFDDYGQYDKNKWRLCRYDAQDTTLYIEYPDMDEDVIPGTAFWLITRSGQSFDIENAVSLNTGTVDTLLLNPGWNQIANPFPYPVAWDSIAITGDVEAPAHYDGDEYTYDVMILDPWEGYFVYNRDNTPAILAIPPVEAENDLGKSAPPVPKATAGGYIIRLAARIPGFELRDTHNFIGLMKDARPGLDSLDMSEAPPIGDYLRVSVIEGPERLTRSYKPTGAEGHTWILDVSSTLPAERDVEIQLFETGSRPDGFDLHILDLNEECPLPIVENRLRFRLRKHFPVRLLKVILGSTDFVEQHRGTVSLVPLDFRLNQNHPNPFNPATGISYQLGKRTHVTLEIYNIQGRKIRTLVNENQSAGFHNLTWEGLDDAGHGVAGGLYLCQMRTESFTSVKKMILLR